MEGPIILTLEKARSIDQIYEEVKDHDLVLTVDAPLADALNARLTGSRFGEFATTPRRLALNELPSEDKIQDKRELFLSILGKMDITLKKASYLFENIVECWKENGDPYELLKEDRYDPEEAEKMIKTLKKTINPYSALERYTVPEEKELGVVSPHQFTELDKKILPSDYDVVEPFTSEDEKLPRFHIFNSTTEIVETLFFNIKDVDPKDVAVVMKKDSEYRYVVESMLRSKDIPYMLSKDIMEREEVRKYLNLIRYSFFKRGLKVKEIRQFCPQGIRAKSEDYLLEAFSDEKLKDIKDLIQNIPKMSFEELLDHRIFECDLEVLREQLEELELLEEDITLDALFTLIYYLDSFDVEVKKAGRGLLIASPGTSTYIDRPIVFYLGMDSSWTPDTPSTPWIDKKEFDERKLKDFKILLQNGKERLFMVQDRKTDRTVTPSFYFNELTDRTITSFRDLKHELNEKEMLDEKTAFEKEKIEAEQKSTKTMSQSALNSFAYCPKDRFFSELIERPDKPYFTRGSLFHDLAEYLLNHPEEAEKKEELIDSVMDEMSPFLEDHQKPLMRTKFEIGFQNIMDFISRVEPQLENPEGYTKKDKHNHFSEVFDRQITTDFTEVSFHNEDIGAKGKVDLVLDSDSIVDHKSGSKKSISELMRRSNIKNIERKVDFQAKMYIAHHRHHHPKRLIKFTYHHLLENEKDVVSGEADPEDNLVNIIYHPRNFDEMIHEEEVYRAVIGDVKASNNRRKTLEKLGFDNYRRFFSENSFLEGDKQEVLGSKLKQEFVQYCKDLIGDYKYVEKGCRSTLKKLVVFRSQNYFKEDIDEFEKFLQENIEEYNRYRKTDFPVGDVDPKEIDNPDLVIL